jgi:hypothetical protein
VACSLVCVFLYARQRCGEWVALLCSLFLIATKLFQMASLEARPYGLMVACFTVALLCHQRLPSPFWAAGMTAALALAQAFHYYAIFGLALFALAEAVLLVARRCFRWYVWLGLAISTLPLVLARNLLKTLRDYYGAHFWSHYGPSDVPKSYGDFLMTSAAVGIAAAVLSLAAITADFWWRRDSQEPQKRGGPRITDKALAEGVLLCSFVLLPFFAFATLRAAHSSMTDRYVIESILGIALGLGLAFRRASSEAVALLAVFVLTLAGLHEFSFWHGTQWRAPNPGITAEKLAHEAGPLGLPVIVAEGTSYVQFVYYAPSLARHLIYLVDAQRAVEFTGTDSVDKGLLLLPDYMPLQLNNPDTFLAEHATFLLYRGDSPDAIDWLTPYLSQTGHSMQLLSQPENGRLYLVKTQGGN